MGDARKLALTAGRVIESPCIRVCTLDRSGELCLGCFRTLDEIGSWASLTDAERERVMALLPARKRQHAAHATSVQPPAK